VGGVCLVPASPQALARAPSVNPRLASARAVSRTMHRQGIITHGCCVTECSYQTAHTHACTSLPLKCLYVVNMPLHLYQFLSPLDSRMSGANCRHDSTQLQNHAVQPAVPEKSNEPSYMQNPLSRVSIWVDRGEEITDLSHMRLWPLTRLSFGLQSITTESPISSAKAFLPWRSSTPAQKARKGSGTWEASSPPDTRSVQSQPGETQFTRIFLLRFSSAACHSSAWHTVFQIDLLHLLS
jgi:hypothetical protein